MNEFIEECKKVLAECRESGVGVKVNGVMFSQKYEFDFNDASERLYIRFNLDFNDPSERLFIRFSIGGIGGIVASICYDEIKSFE